ncbi:MAG: chloramphenicol resistance protein [Ruminococcus sp.]|nr:chloramphenicol resistance protein [Ruminococcus sp.]
MNTIAESIREYILQFPELKDGCLLVDFMGNEPVEYTIETVPCDPVVKKYTDGSCMKQFLFIFASREFYSESIAVNLGNLEFYEHFEDWIKEQNDNGELPELSGNREAVSIEVTTRGYAFEADTNTARYQIQLRLIYEEER